MRYVYGGGSGAHTYGRHKLLECLVESLGVGADGWAAADVQRELSQREDIASAITARKKEEEKGGGKKKKQSDHGI